MLCVSPQLQAVNVLETLVAYVYAERLGERDTALLIDDWCGLLRFKILYLLNALCRCFIGFVIAFVLFFVIWIGPPTYRCAIEIRTDP